MIQVNIEYASSLKVIHCYARRDIVSECAYCWIWYGLQKVVRGPFVTSAVVAKRTFLEPKLTTEYE